MFPVDSHFTWTSFLAALPLVVIVSMLFCAFTVNTVIHLNPTINPLSRMFRVTGWVFCWAVAAFYFYLTWATQNKWIDIKPQMFAETSVIYFRHHGSAAAEALQLHDFFLKSLESQRVSHYRLLYNDVWSCGFFLILPLIGYGFSRLLRRRTSFVDRTLRETSQSQQTFIMHGWTASWMVAGLLAWITWFLKSRWLGGQTFETAWYSWAFGKPGSQFSGLQCQVLAVLVILTIWLFLTPLYLLALKSACKKRPLRDCTKS